MPPMNSHHHHHHQHHHQQQSASTQYRPLRSHEVDDDDEEGDNVVDVEGDDHDDDDDLLLLSGAVFEDAHHHPANHPSRSNVYRCLFLLFLVSLVTFGALLFLLNFHTSSSSFSSLWASTHLSSSPSASGILRLPSFLSSLVLTGNGSSLSEEEGEKYLINTPTCRIERIPPFTDETRPLYEAFPSKVYKCPPDDETAPIARVNYTWVTVPADDCTAVEVLRNERTDGQKYGRKFHFGSQRLMNFEQTDAVEVSCPGMKHTRVVPLIPVKKPLWKKSSSATSTDEDDQELKDRPNILAVGVDSVSRLNFLRHFITTKQLIEREGFTGPLLGLHKIGDNTFPNLIGMFTGMDAGRVDASLPPSRKLDDVPLIFKEFSAAGYLTSYLEQQPSFGLWTYHGRSGFLRQPLEYLMRPVNILVSARLTSWYCYKGRLEFAMYYDYLIDQMLALRERGQHFLNFIHLSSITHDLLNYAQYADGLVEHFLERIFQHKLHQKTLILFYSDHGIRYGPILRTDSGFQESRMPFMYVYVPEGMRLKDAQGRWMDSREIRAVFTANSRRLSSQFDVHATLRHLLKGSPPPSTEGSELYGHSLFSPIPANRTCEQAGIPAEFCLCSPYIDLNLTDEAASNNSKETSDALTSHLLDYLNGKLRPFSSRCTQLTLMRVVTLKISADLSQGDDNNPRKRRRQILLRVQTAPNKGIIEAILLVNTVQNGNGTTATIERDSLRVAGEVIRLDRYAEQSRCAANTEVETFCYCKNLSRG